MRSTKAAIPDLRVGLINAQYDLRDADFPVIIWIAGDDRLAANALVNRLNEWMDSRYVDTRVFADPTEEESQRPQLWRLWRSLPPKGRAAFFVGGLMRAANQRAGGEIGEPEFSAWLRHISQMQAALVADGALILKFFLHTPAKVQKKKLKKAEKHPELGWQVDQRDWAALDTLGPVLPIAERIQRETSGPGTPWTIVEATDDRYRDLTVEPVRARLLKGECLLGEHGRTSRERRYHVAAQLDARRHWAQCPQQDQRIRRTGQRNARRPDTVEAVRRPQSPVGHRSYGSLR